MGYTRPHLISAMGTAGLLKAAVLEKAMTLMFNECLFQCEIQGLNTFGSKRAALLI